MMQNPRKSPVISIAPGHGQMVVANKSSIMGGDSMLGANAATSRLHPTTILSKIMANSTLQNSTIGGGVGGNGVSGRSYGEYTPSRTRSAYSSDLRRLSALDLGKPPSPRDVSQFWSNPDDQQTEHQDSDDSNDTPDEDALGSLINTGSRGAATANTASTGTESRESGNGAGALPDLPPMETSSTHRADGDFHPKLDREIEGYYTSPTITAMQKMSERELYSIHDFKVGHEVHGWVQWNGDTDVRGLDLDKIVDIRASEIEVYNDDITDKPQQGNLLNKHAVIRLFNVWSSRVKRKREQNTNSNMELDSADMTAQKQWGETLQKYWTFREYDETKGEWEFEVEHFTKYGLLFEKPQTQKKEPVRAMKEVKKSMNPVMSDPFASGMLGGSGRRKADVDPIGAAFASEH